jgi:hypothetical protein
MDKFFGVAAKVFGVFIAVVLVVVIFRVAWNFVFYGSTAPPVTDTRGSQLQSSGQPNAAPRRNVVKEKYLNDCAANNAPVTGLGGGRMNCYRAPTVSTIID